MNKMEKENLSKFISLILRHKPETIEIKLDSAGYAKVDELISGIQKSGKEIDIFILEEIVSSDNKQRYSFSEDKTKIRANQGHSIQVDIGLKKKNPPNVLYHGTSKRFLESIIREGIKPMSRLYVHLSKDIETARSVGVRHGEPVVLQINTKTMSELGYDFYLSENDVWLTEYVPSEYIRIIRET